ncbi:hypothetical protein [Gillisia hiemivivida]|uniref:hypothetical protein n=1 Tax=Gillisia hiemivivida TaxID=291190 RepID=UPI0039EEE1FA
MKSSIFNTKSHVFSRKLDFREEFRGMLIVGIILTILEPPISKAELRYIYTG